MSLYDDGGGIGNPFDVSALDADEVGKDLLVGRSTLLKKLKVKVRNGPRVPTLDGLNGSGKTSLSNVAIYSLYQEFVDAQG